MSARGRIEYFEQNGHVSKMLAEAAEAYNIPPSDGTLELWEENLEVPYPAMEPRAEAARRALAFVASESQPWMVVHDYLKAEAPASYQYMLHALQRMDLNEKEGKIALTVGKAQLDVYIMSDQSLRFSQTDQFLVPPGDRYEGADNQYHFMAETSDDKAEVKFLAVFLPYKKGETPPAVEVVGEGSVRGFTVGTDRALAWWGEGETGTLAEGLPAGRMLVESEEQGTTRKVVLE